MARVYKLEILIEHDIAGYASDFEGAGNIKASFDSWMGSQSAGSTHNYVIHDNATKDIPIYVETHLYVVVAGRGDVNTKLTQLDTNLGALPGGHKVSYEFHESDDGWVV